MVPKTRTYSAIQSLPAELLSHIFSFLGGPPPSDSRLHDEPSPTMLVSGDPASSYLKTVSLVSRRWRANVLRLLFRNVAWSFDRWDLLLAEPGDGEQGPDPVSNLPLLAFLKNNNLGCYVDTITLIAGDSMQGMYRLPNAGPSPDTTGPSNRFTPPRPISLVEAQAGMGGGQRPNRREREMKYGEDSNWFWKLLFEIVDPNRFTIIASPRMLASLLSRMLFVGDAWSFKSQWHILSLSRENRKWPGSWDHREQTPPDESEAATPPPPSSSTPLSPAAPSRASGRPCQSGLSSIDSILFTVRPWTSLLLNEGSSTPVYTTYEFFLKRPPSILGALLGCEESPNDRSMVPPSIRGLAYVGIFPLSSHFSSLVDNLPPVDRLFVQLVPRSGVLDEPDRMRCIDPGDLWMERNTCYSLIMRRLFYGIPDGSDSEAGLVGSAKHSWLSLREFESGDAAGKDAWDMAVHHVNMSGTGWRVEGDGVFVKCTVDTTSSDPSMSTSVPELFQGLLVRLAFNGVARLPYSSMGQYVRVDAE